MSREKRIAQLRFNGYSLTALRIIEITVLLNSIDSRSFGNSDASLYTDRLQS